VSRPLFTMYLDGDTGAHDDHLHGDRTSERVVAYLNRLRSEDT
jgi:hypothetical protein